MHSISHTYRFIALVMALLMFTTSAGLAIDMHYCQGQLKSVSLLGKAKSCHEKTTNSMMKNCPHHQKMMEQEKGCSMEKKGCCDNKTLHFQMDQDQVAPTVDVAMSKQVLHFIAAYITVFFTEINVGTPYFVNYKPPLIERDIPVLVQSFLL